ncbi:MAG: adenylate kinase [Candidatus Woesearchaeota archaeon]
MNIVILGAPGVGKGTCSEILAKKYGIPHISTGDIFRQAVASQSELGKRVKRYLDSGELVPDELVIAVVKERLEKDDAHKGFILDGFPRTIAQADAMKDFKDIHVILNFVADRKKIVERLSGRRTCSKCKSIYHVKNSPPKKEGICDKCSGELVQRSDETPAVIMKRLSVYEQETKPLTDYYRNEGILADINANYDMVEIEKIIKQCERAIQNV